MKQKAIIIAVAIVMALSTVVASAQQGPRPSQGDRFGRLTQCLKILELTEDQKGQIRGILESARPTIQAAHQQLREDQEELKALLQSDVKDGCAIGAALIQVGDDRESLRTLLAGVKESIAGVLTSEQKAKLEGCMQAPRDQGPPED